MKTPDLLAVAAVGFIVFVAAMLVLRAGKVARIRKRLAPHVPVEEDHAKRRSGAGGRAALTHVFGATEHALGGLRVWRKLALALERADSSLRPAELFYLMIGAGLAPAFLLKALGAGPGVLLVAFAAGSFVPYAIVRWKGSRRQRAFEEQLPHLLMTMAASLRVGHTFRQSLQTVVDEGEEPASKEFGRVLVESDVGRPMDRALEEMAKRLGCRNFDYVIDVVTIQREVGGSLAGLFDMVAETVRLRQQFSKKVRALTAMGRLSAYVLVALPFVVAGGMTLINPVYMSPLFTTSTGRILMLVALGGILMGALILKKIVAFRMA